LQNAGGALVFFERLDAFPNGHFGVSNEPGLFTPFLHLWENRDDRIVDKMISNQRRHFRADTMGIPGNDDSGAMSSLLSFDIAGNEKRLHRGPAANT
jgi:putative alpha-1,2-mannosidase